MKSLGTLQRLARQAVDRERRALQSIGCEIAETEAEIMNSRQMIEREASLSLDFMTSGATLSAYIAAGKARIQNLQRRLEELQKDYDVQLERVQRERVEEKRYERLAERQAEQAALDVAAKEQKTIDELVIMSGRRD